MNKDIKKIIYPLIAAAILIGFASCETVGQGVSASVRAVSVWMAS